MQHTLVKPDGTVGHSRDFDAAPPVLAESKGRWLPDIPPPFDPLREKLKVAVPISALATQIPYLVKPLGAAQIARNLAAQDAANELTNMRATAFAKQFAAFSVADLDAYIEANCTDLAGLRLYVKRLSRIVLAMTKRELAQ